MEAILRFLETNELKIYLLLGVVGLFYLRKVILAWQEWRGTIFGLERENAQRRLSAALTIVVLLFFFAMAQFLLVTFVSPSFPYENTLLTPTIGVLSTPVPTIQTPKASQAVSQFSVTATPPVQGNGCVEGKLQWVVPKTGDILISGDKTASSVQLKAIVNVPNMGFYKYEYSVPANDNWTTIAAGNKDTLKDDPNLPDVKLIGIWNVSQMVQGDYRLRLVITDNQNQAMPACIVTIRVQLK